MMNSRDPKVRRHYRREWALYEHSICFLEYDLPRFLKATRGRWTQAIAELEAWYIRNRCFIPEGHILRNAKRLRGIPASIIQGRYDFVCPPQYAYRLHKALPRSRLTFVTAGHAATEPAIRDGMMREIHRMARR
jgi:proline iminopeptidase